MLMANGTRRYRIQVPTIQKSFESLSKRKTSSEMFAHSKTMKREKRQLEVGQGDRGTLSLKSMWRALDLH